VGSYLRGRSPEGVEDLIGNVWEWTSSPYRPYGAGTTSASTDLYVIRGGGFNALDAVSTAIFRVGARSAAQRTDLAATGFRCAMTPRKPPS
jgi:iron(II)-dependent oxidoreductase